jgi:hypothetical protein
VILSWTDQDGDPVAIESASIIGISVGTVTGPHRAIPPRSVTLIWADGVPQPFMVAAPFAGVLELWTAARESGGTPGRPGYHGWPVNWWDPHPSTVMPGAPSWWPKTGGR